MPIRPMPGYILIEPAEAESTTTSGIILPETAWERPIQGKVLSVGADTEIKCPVEVGDVVIYKKWGGDELKVGDEEYKVVKFEDLMAVMEW